MIREIHLHAPTGEVQRYDHAKVGQCRCGVDLVSYLAPATARHNWEEWRPTALDDPCLSCGGYDADTCCGIEE